MSLHIIDNFPDAPKKVAVLIKYQLLHTSNLNNYYTKTLVKYGMPESSIVFIGLPYDTFKKVSAVSMNQHLPVIQQELNNYGVEYVLICDTPYFKKFAKLQKVSNLEGEAIPNPMGNQLLVKGINYAALRFSPKMIDQLNMSLRAIGHNVQPRVAGEFNFIHSAEYPTTTKDIKTALHNLMQYDLLSADIEGYGLKLDQCGVATITFTWSEHEGIAFCVDAVDEDGYLSFNGINVERRLLLKQFMTAFIEKGGKFVWHGATFDIKQLVANLWMGNDLTNYEGLVDGTELLCKGHYCTKDMGYLSTNSAEGNSLGLKGLAIAHSGNYAIDVKDITKHPTKDVLVYNLIDGLNTFYLYKKFMRMLTERGQYEVYINTFRPNVATLVAIELYGMPLDMPAVLTLYDELKVKTVSSYQAMLGLPCIASCISNFAHAAHDKYQTGIKGEGRTYEDYIAWKPLEFLPNSPFHLAWILHAYFDLPIIDYTKTKLAATGAKTIKKHLAHAKESGITGELITFLDSLLVYGKVTKIMDFVKAFLKHSILKNDGIYYLHGNFNQGGTISSRLSSSAPNLQNLPSGGYWGKAIKRCFHAPSGKRWLASDYAALESRIAALLSHDENMLKVYTDGYDSHCLNTHAYAEGDEEWLAPITKAEVEFNIDQKFYIITHDDGTEEYLSERQLPF